MYKLAALTCAAIGVFSLGIIHLSTNHTLQQTKYSIDFSTPVLYGEFIIQEIVDKTIQGRLVVTNESNQPLKLDVSRFVIAYGNKPGSIEEAFLPPYLMNPSHCEPVLGLEGYVESQHRNPNYIDDHGILSIPAHQSIGLVVQIVFETQILRPPLQLSYPYYHIIWLDDSIT